MHPEPLLGLFQELNSALDKSKVNKVRNKVYYSVIHAKNANARKGFPFSLYCGFAYCNTRIIL